MSKIIAYVLIPLYTLFFVRGSDWFDVNFSILGNHISRREGFLLWGFIMGIYCYTSFSKVINLGGNKKRERITMTVSMVLLIFAITTPYLPKIYPLKANLHFIFAFSAGVTMLLCMLLIAIRVGKEEKKNKVYLYSLMLIIAISLVLLALTSMVTSALEIFVTITCVYWIESLKNRMIKSKLEEGELSVEVDK